MYMLFKARSILSVDVGIRVSLMPQFLLGVMLCWGLQESCFAQVDAPMSTTGVEQANRLKDAKKDRGEQYNVKLGPIELRLDGGLRQTYNDNIALSERTVEDFITSPIVNINAL